MLIQERLKWQREKKQTRRESTSTRPLSVGLLAYDFIHPGEFFMLLSRIKKEKKVNLPLVNQNKT